jgi:hypothetical protein
MRFPDNHRNLHCAPANAVMHTFSPIASFTFPAHTECFYPNMKTLCRFSVPLLYNMAIPVYAVKMYYTQNLEEVQLSLSPH